MVDKPEVAPTSIFANGGSRLALPKPGSAAQKFNILKLPPEIREMIWKYALEPNRTYPSLFLALNGKNDTKVYEEVVNSYFKNYHLILCQRNNWSVRDPLFSELARKVIVDFEMVTLTKMSPDWNHLKGVLRSLPNLRELVIRGKNFPQYAPTWAEYIAAFTSHPTGCVFIASIPSFLRSGLSGLTKISILIPSLRGPRTARYNGFYNNIQREVVQMVRQVDELLEFDDKDNNATAVRSQYLDPGTELCWDTKAVYQWAAKRTLVLNTISFAEWASPE